MMKHLSFISTVFILFLALFSCGTEDTSPSISCDQQVVINADEYDPELTRSVAINSLEIIGNCLKVNYSASGCSGSTFNLRLVDSGEVTTSEIPQRNLVLLFESSEPCAAVFTKEVLFDISALQVDENQVQINITNTDYNPIYQY